MSEPEYREIAWAERVVDCYGGRDCTEHIAQWKTFFEGDMDEDVDTANLILKTKQFPPGTKVIISCPCCPECGEIQELCECGFDWHAWAEERYA